MNALTVASDASALLARTNQVTVTQKKEWGEILIGWETRNRYQVTGPDGNPLFWAGEVGGSFLARGFLKAKRPFTLEVRAAGGALALRLRRPWTWFFSRAEVADGNGQPLGAIQQRFAFFRKKHDIEDATGQVVATLLGPIFRPWTFEIRKEDRACGVIRKKWSGLLKEAFTDADTFGVEFGPEIAAPHRPILLAATFLIDFVHFENR